MFGVALIIYAKVDRKNVNLSNRKSFLEWHKMCSDELKQLKTYLRFCKCFCESDSSKNL